MSYVYTKMAGNNSLAVKNWKQLPQVFLVSEPEVDMTIMADLCMDLRRSMDS